MKNSQINSPAPKVLRATLQHFQIQKRSWTWGFALLGVGALLLMPSLRFHSDPEAFYPRGEAISEAHDHFNRQFQSQKSLSIWIENPQEKPEFLETCQTFCEQWKGKDGLVSAELPMQQNEWQEGLPIPLPELNLISPASPYYSQEQQVYKADFKFESTEQLLAFVRDSAFQSQLKSLDFPAYTHSGLLLYEYINQDLARSLFKSLSTSGLAIIFILWLLTRSWKQALIGLIPNLLPLSAAVWAFTLLGVDLNLITAITAVVCLGLLDDDTVHVLYRRMILKEPLGGLEHSMLDSAILLSLGFGLFAFSRFYPTQVFGAVSALVFIVGILGELTFFQQVLDRFGRKD
jgi:predicted RND superfamily exporter protein